MVARCSTSVQVGGGREERWERGEVGGGKRGQRRRVRRVAEQEEEIGYRGEVVSDKETAVVSDIETVVVKF